MDSSAVTEVDAGSLSPSFEGSELSAIFRFLAAGIFKLHNEPVGFLVCFI